MGFMLADPLMGKNMFVIAGALFALVIPLALSFHHAALIWASTAYINAFFLPGQPQIWMAFAALSFGIMVLSWPLAKTRVKPVWDKPVLYSLMFLALVAFLTAVQTGGIGLRVLGSATYGGRKYFWIFAAVVGFMALTFQSVARKNVQRDVTAFCLAPMTAAISNIAYALGPTFYFLYLLFPVEMAITQASADFGPVTATVKRFNGLGPTAIAIAMFCFMRWGLRGIADFSKPWRVLLLAAGLFLGLFSGFRSTVAICVLIAAVQFMAEGLYRTRYALIVAALAAGGLIFIAAFSTSLPLAAQRAISFLPVEVDPSARLDAEGSLQWRLKIWKMVAEDIPQYFWIGKGYAMDPNDIYFFNESMKRGFMEDYEFSVRAGDYHSGPLSILIPFGVWGMIGFIWFCWASYSVLWRNMRYGDPELKTINTFFFSYFVARVIFFVLFFGGLEVDIWIFASLVGVNLAINGGAKQKPRNPTPHSHRALPTRAERELISI